MKIYSRKGNAASGYSRSEYSTAGYALLIVLFSLLLMSYLQIKLLQNSHLMMRSAKAFIQSNAGLSIAEVNLKNAERDLIEHAVICFIPMQRDAQLQNQSMAWWSSQCTGQYRNSHYYYAIENLGEDVCAIIDSRHYAAFYRINVLTNALHTQEKLLLQSVLVLPKLTDAECRQKSYSVTSGRQSIRLIERE